MTTLTRPLNMTSSRQTLTFPVNGYDPNVTAYLWGAGGGAGGSDAARQEVEAQLRRDLDRQFVNSAVAF